jgi:threonine synthase
MPTLLERYREFLPLGATPPWLTLGEGGTPLIRARRLGEEIGCPNLHLKFEGMNPTGSFKDRGMVLAVTKALERGASAVICASTGNTAASAAAYAAAAGIRCSVVLPAGYVAPGKLAQALVYGARVVAIDGTFDRALELVREAVETSGAELVNSLNPNRIEGQKTAAFEICDALQRAPDIVCLPVGNAGNITAYWKGFREYREAGRATNVPRMWGFQAAGAAPLVYGHPIEEPRTVATAIRIGNPARGDEALAAVSNSGGLIDAVTDEEIMEAYRMVASHAGLMCEPASAAGIAGLLKRVRSGDSLEDQTVVVILTGHGLKDPATALSLFEEMAPVAPTVENVLGTVAAAPV